MREGPMVFNCITLPSLVDLTLIVYDSRPRETHRTRDSVVRLGWCTAPVALEPPQDSQRVRAFEWDGPGVRKVYPSQPGDHPPSSLFTPHPSRHQPCGQQFKGHIASSPLSLKSVSSIVELVDGLREESARVIGVDKSGGLKEPDWKPKASGLKGKLSIYIYFLCFTSFRVGYNR
ncbi:hypothetical protein BKA70DRAFT_103655 [Coprinopsis sp. MPI-PUGE-AT-0042]|nr:hypothetical protein BKA70DRAFT_103655 [Coprinopsis sp. MPI-PUGE-AT-0042]